MSAQRLDGKAVAARVRAEIATEVAKMVGAGERPPALDVILVGEDPASTVYVRNKEHACEIAGIRGRVHRLPLSTSTGELRERVLEINGDRGIDGLLVQLPLPPAIDPAAVRSWIDPRKDVDGLHPENVGLLASGTPRFVPCTPAGCMEMLRAYDIPTSGRTAVVIGRSLIVGRPMANLLSTKGIDATVTVCHTRTPDLSRFTLGADIIVAAAGIPHLLRAEHVCEGAVVLDVGIHRIEDAAAKTGSRLVGDVHPEVAEKAAWISPVPGGVGPMTIAMLLRNTVKARREA